jgi:hypothetical protein
MGRQTGAAPFAFPSPAITATIADVGFFSQFLIEVKATGEVWAAGMLVQRSPLLQ